MIKPGAKALIEIWMRSVGPGAERPRCADSLWRTSGSYTMAWLVWKLGLDRRRAVAAIRRWSPPGDQDATYEARRVLVAIDGWLAGAPYAEDVIHFEVDGLGDPEIGEACAARAARELARIAVGEVSYHPGCLRGAVHAIAGWRRQLQLTPCPNLGDVVRSEFTFEDAMAAAERAVGGCVR